jgi:hypothetical protein
MFRYAGRTVAFAAALIVAVGSGVLVSCGGSSVGDGIFSYARPPSSGDITTLIPVPIRREYLISGEFKRDTDLSVMAVYANGETMSVSVGKIDISIGEGAAETHLGTGGTYTFEEAVDKIVNLEYAKQTARYAVWVRGSINDDPGSDSPGSNGGGGTAIIINVIE